MGGGQLNKAFTLIELLAIIVILAIIAVITIPIILNIVDNSSKGAALDSAYGYKDAINNYYLEKLSDDSSFKLDDNHYLVKSDGSIASMNLETNEYGISHKININGTKPTGGYIEYQNNRIVSGCLNIDGYKVTIEDGNVTNAEKGMCKETSLTACSSENYHPSPVEWFKFNASDPTMLIGFQEKDDEHPNGWDGATEITIPCKNPDGQDITSISNGAFQNANVLTSVVVPDTVTLISNGAFGGNPIKQFVIGQNVEEISNSAFNMSGMPEGAFSLKTLVLPDSLKSIKNGVFESVAIENLVFDGDVDTIINGTFLSSSIGNLTFNGNVENIAYSFNNNIMGNIEFKGTVGTIVRSFRETSVTKNIIFNDSVGTITDGSFYAGTTTDGTFHTGVMENLEFKGNVDTISNGCFCSSSIENLEFKGNVNTITGACFINNSFNNLVFNGNVNIIEGSFRGHNMRSFILPQGLDTVEGSFNSEYLEEITFSKNTGDIVNFAWNFPNLKTIYNNTGKAYDWNEILGNTSSEPFITGTVTREDGSIVNILESN
ncbi:MAG: leucine-rich repeat protein [Bacilli bacterium]|nr:leucine-rich repeat protein [Bacilli bacterium]